MKHITLLLFFVLSVSNVFGQAPTTNAADPEARDAENVISIFSGAYTNIEGVNFNPNWGQAGLGTANTAFDPGTGNIVLAYPNFNYQGIEYATPENRLDISAMEYLHVDIWVDGTFNPNVFVISSGAEIAHPITNTGAATWISVDIPVAGITGDLAGAFQFKFDGGNGTTDAIYVDNLYFWKNAVSTENDATLSDLQVDGETISGFSSSILTYTVGLAEGTTTAPQITTATPTQTNASASITQATSVPGDATVEVTAQDGTTKKTYTVSFAITTPGTAAPTPPARNTEDVVSIFSDAYTDISVETFSAAFDDSEVEDVTIDGNAAKKISFGNFIGVEFLNDRADLTAMTHFHIDFWTGATELDGKVFNQKLSNWSTGDGEANALELPINTGTNPAIVSKTWVSVDVALDSFTPINGSARDGIAQFLITSNLGEVFVDNIYFYKGMGVSNEDKELPEGFVLNQNYPNPFNPSTNISYSIPANGNVMLEVFNIQGQKVATLVEGFKSAGSHNLTFNASNLASGVYTYRLTAGNSVQVKKMLLIK